MVSLKSRYRIIFFFFQKKGGVLFVYLLLFVDVSFLARFVKIQNSGLKIHENIALERIILDFF